MAFIKNGWNDAFLDTDKEFSPVLCPYGNRKKCTYKCAKLRVRKTPEGRTILIFNCGGKPLEMEMYTSDEWYKLHPPKAVLEGKICSKCGKGEEVDGDPDTIKCKKDGELWAAEAYCKDWEAKKPGQRPPETAL